MSGNAGGIGCARPAAVAVLAMVGCGAESIAAKHTRDIIDDLVAQDFGAASNLYRKYESEVLSLEAAPVWRRALAHSDPTVREWAVDSLSRIGAREDVDRIAGLLDDPSRGVRHQALDAFIRIDSGAARDSFCQRLGRSAPEQVVLAAQGLAQIGAVDASSAILRRAVDTALPESTRGALMQPLAALGDPGVVAPLVDLALDVLAGVQLRRLAADAAVSIDTPDRSHVLRRLATAKDAYVVALSERALGLK